MRLLTVALGLAMLTPVCARAQAPATADTSRLLSPSSDQALSDIAFVNRSPAVGLLSPPAFGEVIPTPAFVGQSLSGQPQLVTSRVAAVGEGLIAWRTTEVSRLTGDGAVDSVRMSVQGISRTPLVGPNTVYDPNAVNVTFTRGWPGAVLVRAGGVGLSVSPHAGIGFDSTGANSAQAGAMFRFSSVQTALEDRLNAMGVKSGSTYGDQGRWYLFAAVQGQSVGLNMMPGAGGLHQAGWSTDASSALVGDGQVGVGWRKGTMEASFGYVHRGVRIENAPIGASDSFQYNLAALSFTFHPGW